jgi:chromosome partition protein MukE
VTRGFAQLQDVIADPDFPSLDLALRRGRHVDREDAAWYALLLDAQEQLEAFYRRFGCDLIHKSDGYFYLLPTGDQLARRHLVAGDMLVGQALALLYLDPTSVERGGLVTREQVIEQLLSALGSEALVRAFLPKRKRQDEQVAQRAVRSKINEALRRLSSLGFAEVSAEEQIRLRPGLLRFAEPVRGLSEPAEALARLVAEGEVAMADDLALSDDADGGGAEDLAEEVGSDDGHETRAGHGAVQADAIGGTDDQAAKGGDEETDANCMAHDLAAISGDDDYAADGGDEPDEDEP